MNKESEQLAKEVLARVAPQGHTHAEIEILINAFAVIADRIQDRQKTLPRGAYWSMSSWVKYGGPVVI